MYTRSVDLLNMGKDHGAAPFKVVFDVEPHIRRESDTYPSVGMFIRWAVATFPWLHTAHPWNILPWLPVSILHLLYESPNHRTMWFPQAAVKDLISLKHYE